MKDDRGGDDRKKGRSYSSMFFAINLSQDKFGPPAGGPRSVGHSSSSSRYEQPRDYGRGSDYSYSSSSRRDHHNHDMYDGAGSGSMASIPSGPAAGSGDQIYVRNVSFLFN